MKGPETAVGGMETGVPRAPVLRVVAADSARAARMARLLADAGAEARIAGGAGLSAVSQGAPADAVLVVVEGFEAELETLTAPHLYLVALDPQTPPRVASRSVLPAYAPGALQAWVELAFERARADHKSADAEAGLLALMEKSRHGLIVIDESDRIIVANEAASEILGGHLLEFGARVPVAVPEGSSQRIVSYESSSLVLEGQPLSWRGRQARLLRLEPAAGEGSFDGRLAHADRLAAVGALAAGFAHEVNNPAQSVTADLTELTELLRTFEWRVEKMRALVPAELQDKLSAIDLDGPLDDGRDLLQECFDGLGRIAGIVRDLKSFSRIQPDRVDWIHPNEVVNQACAIANNHIRHRARLVKDLGAFEVFPGDRNKLVQVVTNLLVNAAQALPEGADGIVDQQVLVRTRVDEGRVVISVVDSGVGITPEVLARIFEPFFTTKEHADGTGLGLAMSLDIARQHGGTLEVESEVGVGTRFDLIVPIDNGLEVQCRTECQATPELLQRGRVLVVDDEPGILRSLGRLIGRNHDVVTRGDGRAALELLKQDDHFDVILCDLMMPDVDGPMLHEVLAEGAPRLAGKMVFMSGGAFTDRAQRFLERAKPVVLDKPAPASMLEQAIQRVLAKPRDTAELPSVREQGPPTRTFA